MRHVFLALTWLANWSIAASEDYNQWAFKKIIKVNTAQGGAAISSDQIGFPALLRITSELAEIFSQANEKGTDLRFSKPDGSHLPYQIESWDQSNKQASVWVRLDTIRGGNSNQTFFMYWGKPGAIDSSNGSSVFQTANGFQGVWHLGNNLEDATANKNNGVDSGSASEPQGIIGTGRKFVNPMPYVTTGQYISLGNPSSLNFRGQLTLEAWVKWSNRDGHRIILCHGSGASGPTSAYETVLRIGENKDYRAGVWDGSTAYHAILPAPTTDSLSWTHLVGVYNGSTWNLYRNGVIAPGSKADTGGSRISQSMWRIGAQSSSGSISRYFNGSLDEIRISSVARTADWIRLNYENQRDNQLLVTYGETIVSSMRSGRIRPSENSRAFPMTPRNPLFLYWSFGNRNQVFNAKGASISIDGSNLGLPTSE